MWHFRLVLKLWDLELEFLICFENRRSGIGIWDWFWKSRISDSFRRSPGSGIGGIPDCRPLNQDQVEDAIEQFETFSKFHSDVNEFDETIDVWSRKTLHDLNASLDDSLQLEKTMTEIQSSLSLQSEQLQNFERQIENPEQNLLSGSQRIGLRIQRFTKYSNRSRCCFCHIFGYNQLQNIIFMNFHRWLAAAEGRTETWSNIGYQSWDLFGILGSYWKIPIRGFSEFWDVSLEFPHLKFWINNLGIRDLIKMALASHLWRTKLLKN